MSNHLKNATSPYLLQHAENPVDWYPWCKQAFEKAKSEDKPIFLSIGYSTCHWCHVMAHESFEDKKTAEILNQYFVSIKIDREERPDIDSVYMSVCQAFTGSGGWPMSIFMTWDKKPFFAGTYFPPKSHYGMPGFPDLLDVIVSQWNNNRRKLLQSAEQIITHLKSAESGDKNIDDEELIKRAMQIFSESFDEINGGFSSAPKFPTPHNLLFLMLYAKHKQDSDALKMAEKTLLQMRKGGIFDHIGYGFSRYSTDKYFLAPHFEKMLYDNALLIFAYIRAYSVTGDVLYRSVAERTARYVLREMTDPDGAFYSAQDADSAGGEGNYYLFSEEEILRLLGAEEGKRFASAYGITKEGNFKGKNIPNLLRNDAWRQLPEPLAERVYAYRKTRMPLNVDDKLLMSSCSLMIAALAFLYRITGTAAYLDAARRAERFLQCHLTEGENVFVSLRLGRRGAEGFLADYAFYAFALLQLHEALPSENYLERAAAICKTAIRKFRDPDRGGFYLYAEDAEQLITRPKDTYDGALPSGNSVIAYVLVKLSNLLQEEALCEEARRQVLFLCEKCAAYPAGSCFFLLALLRYLDPPARIVCVTQRPEEIRELPLSLQRETDLIVRAPSEEQPLLNGKTTFYVCKARRCFPPTDKLERLMELLDEA